MVYIEVLYLLSNGVIANVEHRDVDLYSQSRPKPSLKVNFLETLRATKLAQRIHI